MSRRYKKLYKMESHDNLITFWYKGYCIAAFIKFNHEFDILTQLDEVNNI